ncbi:MAG TPA: argininosuccinate lyase [Phycisphaerales bacterium]|nr:argininosuccinate lyase [Phycisphaerales bacterium]
MAKSEKSWERRLAGAPDDLAVSFVESLSYDRRLYKYDIVGSIAHAAMLAECGLITQAESDTIHEALLEIGKEIAAGRFVFRTEHEDIHMAIEAALVDKIGDVGRKLHTGRSRNDQVATDLRLWTRDEVQTLQTQITALQQAFLDLAEKHTADVMPVYTHLQRAQPVVIAAYLLSFIPQLQRDYLRLANTVALADVCPLGAGAIAGSTLPLDRRATANALAFAGRSVNSIDSVTDRDFCADFLFDCSLIAAHLSRLAEDWIIFSTSEFAFIRIADSFCTSSSMMPQKRNPDMLELIRGKTGRVYGSLVAMLTLLKAQPTGYNRDLQEDKVHVFAAADTTEACLNMAAAIVRNTTFNTARIAAGLDTGFLDATALAEYLVRKGIPFRKAHGIVGALVAECEKADMQLGDLSIETLRAHCTAVGEDVYDYLGPANVVKHYATDGAGGTMQAEKQIADWRKVLAAR